MQKLSNNAEETASFAKDLLDSREEKVWLLYGNLAAGKTTFVKSLAKELGQDPKKVKSPTFAFMNEYEHFIHYDLYRLEALDQMTQEQLEEHLNGEKYVFIEWPEKVEDLINVPHIKLYFSHEGDDKRLIEVA